MCQGVVIALALAGEPQLLIADEPTTGLDVTTQKTVMDLIATLTRELGMAVILVTHDLGLAATYCDRVVVMEKGKVVEVASAASIFKRPAHPYTRKLVRATPRPGVELRDLLPIEGADPPASPAGAMSGPILLQVENLVKVYPGHGKRGLFDRLMRGRSATRDTPPRAVDCIDLAIRRGECLGLVGESGCGKSTTSMMLMRLIDATAGRIVFDGEDIGAIPARDFAASQFRRRIQMVFQDPGDSLNPRYTAGRAIADPLPRMRGLRGRALRAQVEALAGEGRLPVELLDRFPHQLSCGRKARVGIAR